MAEQHVKEDLGWIPTVQDWLKHLRLRPWMGRPGKLLTGTPASEPLTGPAAGGCPCPQ